MEAKVAARVLNLSLTGMSIETDEPLVVGKPCQVELHHEDLTFEAVGTVVWSRPRELPVEPPPPEVPPRSRGPFHAETTTVYEAGVRFDSETAALETLLGSSAVILFEEDGLAAELSSERHQRDCRLVELGPERLVVVAAEGPAAERVLLTLEVDGDSVRLPGRVQGQREIASPSGGSATRVEIALEEIEPAARLALQKLIDDQLYEDEP